MGHQWENGWKGVLTHDYVVNRSEAGKEKIIAVVQAQTLSGLALTRLVSFGSGLEYASCHGDPAAAYKQVLDLSTGQGRIDLHHE